MDVSSLPPVENLIATQRQIEKVKRFPFPLGYPLNYFFLSGFVTFNG
jgi:hypothetical protein